MCFLLFLRFLGNVFTKEFTRGIRIFRGSVSEFGRSFFFGGGVVLSWNISSFIEVLEDGIMNSVWRCIYFRTFSCRLVGPIFFTYFIWCPFLLLVLGV